MNAERQFKGRSQSECESDGNNLKSIGAALTSNHVNHSTVSYNPTSGKRVTNDSKNLLVASVNIVDRP